MGIPQGPFFGKILAAVRDERMNGKIKTKKDELEFAKKYSESLIKKADSMIEKSEKQLS
jgi:hypothetical protein